MGNAFDAFAVCIKKDAEVVGHIPRNILSICGLIFVDQMYTTKSTKFYTPQNLICVRYFTYNI